MDVAHDIIFCGGSLDGGGVSDASDTVPGWSVKDMVGSSAP